MIALHCQHLSCNEKHQQDAVGDDILNPQCQRLANWMKHTHHVRLWLICSIMKKMLSLKLEVHTVLHCWQRNEPPSH